MLNPGLSFVHSAITKEDVEQYFGGDDYNCQCVAYVNEVPHESRPGYVRNACKYEWVRCVLLSFILMFVLMI